MYLHTYLCILVTNHAPVHSNVISNVLGGGGDPKLCTTDVGGFNAFGVVGGSVRCTSTVYSHVMLVQDVQCSC